MKKIVYHLIDFILPILLIQLLAYLLLPETYELIRYLIIGIFGSLLFIIIANIQNLYQNISTQNLYQTGVLIYKDWLFIGFLAITIGFLLRDTQNLARHVLLISTFINPLLLLSYRVILRKLNPRIKQSILIIGNEYSFTKYELAYFKKQHIILIDCEAKIEAINSTLSQHKVDHIVINNSSPNNELIKFLTQMSLKGKRYLTLEHFMERFLHKCYIPYNQLSLSHLDSIKKYTPQQLIIKTIIDFIVIIFIAILGLPIFIFASIKIKIQSKGSVFFKQTRIGLNNKEFTLVKFRSMHENQHHDPYTRENDARIFPFGKTMRQLRIDELPQIFNILKRNIHLIGPRAEWNILISEYEKEIPYYNERHIIKPGITGWAQVNYPYGANVEDSRQKLMYDLYYIKYWNLALELETIWKTIKVVLTKQGT
jgi:lipopolysaccharide/colanic/teichoic acid biosynthesis glycosyltransferase